MLRSQPSQRTTYNQPRTRVDRDCLPAAFVTSELIELTASLPVSCCNSQIQTARARSQAARTHSHVTSPAGSSPESFHSVDKANACANSCRETFKPGRMPGESANREKLSARCWYVGAY